MTLEDLFSKVTFLLGAGASKDAKCFLSGDMLRSLRRDIEFETSTPEEMKLRENYRDIHDFVVASLNYQSTLTNPISPAPANIEDFVSIINQIIDKEYIVPYPLIGNWNEKISRWESGDKDIFRKFRNFIESLLITKYLRHDPNENAAVLSPIMKMLCGSSEPFEMDIFSLNYDLTFEDFFNKPEEALIYNGFEAGKWVGDYEDPNHPQKLKYYKLHGSINWYLNKEDEGVYEAAETPVPDEPLIIFGSANKMLSFDPFLFMLSKFRQKLGSSILYVVIGYSFHDKYINNLLIQQLAAEPERKMLVVDILPRTSEEFVSNLESVQNSKSINDKINFTRISTKKVEVIRLTAKQFYSQYFPNGANELIQKVEELGREIRPF